MTEGFDVFWWFWQVVLMVLMFWQQVLMFLMILTGGFCFWRLYNKWQKVLMFLMILTGGFDGFDVFDSRFWWFWQKVFVFEGCILNHVIHTEGFVLWRRCYQEIPLPPAASHSSVYKWVSVFYINQKEKTWATWAWTVYRRSTSPACPERKPVRFTPAISPETSPDRKTLCPTPPSSPATSLDSVFLYGKTIYII